MSRKNPFLAAALSIVFPGGGQLYNQQKKKTLVWYVIFFLLPIVFVLCRCLHSFWGLVLLFFLYVWLYLYNVGDAVYSAVRKQKTESRTINKTLLFALVIFIVADVYIIVSNSTKNTIGLRAMRIITNSMAPTLQAGDSFILDLNYYKKNDIQRGDLIAFLRASYRGPLCKRVIGLPGDRIEGRSDEIVINDAVFPEPYAHYFGRNAELDDFNRKHQAYEFGPITVPGGKLFVMGDNRDNSYDSRDPDFGFVPIDSVWAKPLYIYLSSNRSRIGKTLK
ncbi:MAG: signal peptidase I [Candidatus Aminicenantes bacterium]|nr:MAG: signal peptidase I [Candidatus Aminicenantes bacterium]